MHDLYFHCWLPCHPAVYQQSTDSQSIVGQLSANCWQTRWVTQWDLIPYHVHFWDHNRFCAGANCVLTILVLRASLIVLTFILSSHLVIVIAVCWKKKNNKCDELHVFANNNQCWGMHWPTRWDVIPYRVHWSLSATDFKTDANYVLPFFFTEPP